MNQNAKAQEGGFSLVELLVAMVVTLIVTGAIYGLIAGGQNAFRREPELSDRQQNIRIAMSMIEKDVESAGVGLGPWAQVFTPGFDNVGPNGEDELEIVTAVAGCPYTEVCVRQPDNGSGDMVLQTPLGLPACFGAPPGPPPPGAPPRLAAAAFKNPISSADVNQYVIGPITNVGVSGNSCQAAGALANAFGVTVNLRLTSGPPSWITYGTRGALDNLQPIPLVGTAAAPNALVPLWIVPVQVIRYVVAVDPSEPSGDANLRHLWRSETGGRTSGDNFLAPNPPPGPGWQLVARGIQDLQVTYVDGTNLGAAPADQPQTIGGPPGVYNTLVRQVNVTLSSRVAGVNIAGFSGTDLTDPNQIRLAQLSSQIAPRATLVALQQAPPGSDQWR